MTRAVHVEKGHWRGNKKRIFSELAKLFNATSTLTAQRTGFIDPGLRDNGPTETVMIILKLILGLKNFCASGSRPSLENVPSLQLFDLIIKAPYN
jgi:hypothetical protein